MTVRSGFLAPSAKQKITSNPVFLERSNGGFYFSTGDVPPGNFLKMIYIKEIPEGEKSIIIQIDGSLEPESVSVLKEICERHLATKARVTLNLERLFYISRDGMNYLDEIKSRVIIIGV
jgi:hypothetical protein